MPVYKQPLYIAASQYINDSNSSTLTPPELDSLGTRIKFDLQDEFAFNQTIKHGILLRLNEMESQGFKLGDKLCDQYLLLLSTYFRALRSSRYLSRVMDNIERKQSADLSIRFGVLALSPDGPDEQPPRLVGGSIRPSQKIKIYYSKLFKENMDLTNRQWNLIESLFPFKPVDSAGRPPQQNRAVLNGIFWKLRTGAAWNDLPLEYPSHQTCYRYFNKWVKVGILDKILRILLFDLKSHGLDLNRAIQKSEIEVFCFARQTVIRFTPRLQDTWQGSTALLLLQVLLVKLRKRGGLPRRAGQIYPSTREAGGF